MRLQKRVTISAVRLDRYLTKQLHKTPGFEGVSLSAGYRLRVPDASGCNWSGDVTPMYDTRVKRVPPPESFAAALPPIVMAARAHFNLSD